MSDTSLLSLIVFLPTLGAALLLLFPKGTEGLMKWFTLLVTIVGLYLVIVLMQKFMALNPMGPEYPAKQSLAVRAELTRGAQGIDSPTDLIVRYPWIDAFNIEYFLGVDGISMSLVLLTGILSVLSMLASFPIEKHVRGYCILYLLLVTGMYGVFLALDFFLFYVFFEVMLLPMYFLIGIWGGPRREYAAIKFFLYTLFGSILILIAMIAFFYTSPTKTFDLLRLAEMAREGKGGPFSFTFQNIMFVLLMVGFAIKVPVVPFHTWLPDAHVEAPTPISMILAGVLLKIGGYGFIRIAYPLCPAGAYYFAFPVAIIGVVSIIYGALAAMAQTDFKKLVAYSSVSHMGYITLGISVLPILDRQFYAMGVAGALFQMIAHGVSSAGMFFLVGVIYERAHHRDLNKFGGLMNAMPLYGGLSTVIFFAGMGLPALCGFIGEVTTVIAGFRYSHALGIIAAAGVILTAGYILWTVQRVFYGVNDKYKGTPDVNFRERIIAIPLVLLAILLGIYPNLLLNWTMPDVYVFVDQMLKFGTDNLSLILGK